MHQSGDNLEKHGSLPIENWFASSHCCKNWHQSLLKFTPDMPCHPQCTTWRMCKNNRTSKTSSWNSTAWSIRYYLKTLITRSINPRLCVYGRACEWVRETDGQKIHDKSSRQNGDIYWMLPLLNIFRNSVTQWYTNYRSSVACGPIYSEFQN